MAKVFLGLGSNLGDRLDYIKQALEKLKKSGVKVRQVSSVYRSAPVEYEDQPDFLNIVAEVRTRLAPDKLLEVIHGIERSLGRERLPAGRQGAHPKGPRTIDIDILLYDRERVDEPELVIPHPKMAERVFVLMPLLEIAPLAKFPSGQVIAKDINVSDLESGKIQKVGRLS